MDGYNRIVEKIQFECNLGELIVMNRLKIFLCFTIGVLCFVWVTTTPNLINLLAYSLQNLLDINQGVSISFTDCLISILLMHVSYFIIYEEKTDIIYSISSLLRFIIFTILVLFDKSLAHLIKSSCISSLQDIYIY